MRPTAERLADALAALRVHVETVTVESRLAPLAAYPGGGRPTSVVRLAGPGGRGAGEHVGWTMEAHADFARAAERVPRGAHRLGDWCAAMHERVPAPYDRAALEAAAIDLALGQCERDPFDLAGVPPRRARAVRSFDRDADPRDVLARTTGDLKLDAHPDWPAETLAALAASGRVAVVDWKTGGTPAQHARFAAALPDALIEDPGPPEGGWHRAPFAGRVVADGWLAQPGDLGALPGRPAAVNVKTPRMGGVFAALALAAEATALGIPVYVGGMFEVDVGRRQMQTLAAILAPEGPNDVAPIVRP